MDPRLAVVERRLAGCRRIVAVTGGKGGIGKSFVASSLALVLADEGKRTGLLDLDLTGPCDHVFLGADDRFPVEDRGIEPTLVAGVRFLSVTFFAKDRPAPLRGPDATNALIELLAITRWGDLDFLVIDMPPGIGDAILDAVRLVPRAEYLVVATPSKVVVETVRRTLRLLTELRAPVLGVVANASRGDSSSVREMAAEHAAPFLGEIPYDEGLEVAVGDAALLRRTPAVRAVREIARASL